MKKLILILGSLIILAIIVCLVINFYTELSIGALVGFVFGFGFYFYNKGSDKNKDELIYRIGNWIVLTIEFLFFAFMCTGLLFRYQMGNLIALPGIGLGILFGFLYDKSNKH